MVELITFGGLVVTAMLAVFVLTGVVFLVKGALLLVLLPLRLVLGGGLHLIFLVLKLALLLVVLPLLAVGGVALLVAGVFGVLVPLLPLALVGLLIWAIVRAASPPTALTPRA